MVNSRGGDAVSAGPAGVASTKTPVTAENLCLTTGSNGTPGPDAEAATGRAIIESLLAPE